MNYEFNDKSLGCTIPEKLNVTYEWRIHNFSISGKVPGESIRSPSFKASKSNEYEWYMSLYPAGYSKEYKGYVSVGLYRALKPADIQIQYCIINNQGEEKNVYNTVYNISLNSGDLAIDFIKLDKLMDRNENLLTDDLLVIQCKLAVNVGKIKNYHFQDMLNVRYEESKLKIYNELENILESKDLTDITLIVNKKEFSAHKTILAARSPVFLAIFKNDMKEKAECKIEIPDFDSDVIAEMLRYIYTGKIIDIEKYAYDLLQVADKYVLEGLKITCERFLYDQLSIANVVKILLYSYRYNCEDLKTLVINFICVNGECVTETSEFKALKITEPHLVIEVLSAMLKKILS